MNSKLYKQADSRWGSKPYPSGSTMSGCGCGCVACTHVVIEQEKYKNYTPENLRPWMVSQGFAIRGQGTTWNGITKTLQHYGYKVTHIGVNDPMSKAWTELDKGNRIGVILFKGGKAPNGTVWTASGHYVAFTDYKKQNGLHYFYTKDSGGRNHDSAKYGYYSYEKSMKGLVYQMWIVQRVGAEVKTTSTTTTTKTTTSTGTLAVDGKFGPASVRALQKVLGTTQDGKITGQTSTLKKYHTGFSGGIVYGKGGSACVKALQKMLKLSGPDGQLGPNTIKAFQKYLGMSGPDGYWGPNTSKAVQKWLNTKLNPTPTSTPPKTTTTTPTTTTTTPTTSTAKSEEVIDVSYVQSKTIDWAKVKAAGIAGAIVRCGYRGYGSGSLNEDSMFMNHVQGAYKAGLKIGIYFFTEAINEAEGREEARFALKMLQKSGVKLTYPIAIDTENINASNPTPRANSGKLSTANRTAAIKGFCDEIKKNGYEPMIYASTSWLNNQLNMSQLPYKVWVAQYNTKVTYGGSYIIWQYTSTAKINGIDGVVDKNHSYYALGNTTPVTVTPAPTPTPAPTLKSIEVVAQEVLDGKWGSGDTRKQKLTAAGYNYDAVQKKVNEILENKKPYSNLKENDYIGGNVVRIGQATSNENGNLTGGKAGDQNGKEVSMANWSYVSGGKYNTWTHVFRAKDATARLKIAQAAIDACNNNHIGYDIGSTDRKSCFKAAQAVNFDLSKVTKDCELTCSELANVCIAAAGLKSYLPVSKAAYVDSLKNVLKDSSEFIMYTAANYTSQFTNLLPGDIIMSSSHTAIVIKIPAKKTIEQLAQEVLNGNWGSGDIRKKNLEAAGYDYDAVQKKVNEILASRTQSTTVKIGQAASDIDKKAGDGGGREVAKTNFKYSTSSTSPFNWTYVFRPKDAAKAEKAASMCEKAIANNNIGYSKSGETAYGKDKAMTKLAKAVNYDLSKINVKCGLSCGDLICLCNHYAGLSTCYIGSGLQLANNYKNNSNFTCITYKKDMALKRGDVLITAHSNGKNNHVAMVL